VAYYGELKHPLQGKIFRNIIRPSAEDISAIGIAYSGYLVDRMGKLGVVHPGIKPLGPEMKVCGPAITVLGPDLTMRRMASDLAHAGDVLVIAAGGGNDYACFGDGTALKMSLGGVAGVVIDGPTRDAERIRMLGFPCFCSGTNLRNYDYPVFPKFGGINVPVVIGGVHVEPGDLIFGDSDGVLVIPRNFVNILAKHVLEDFANEGRERASLKSPFKFDVEQELIERGYDVQDGPYSGGSV
jgi:4-hydroxy-4-methyl-2-oxoglutarate aldolase